jgi:hypothetical protein
MLHHKLISQCLGLRSSGISRLRYDRRRRLGGLRGPHDDSTGDSHDSGTVGDIGHDKCVGCDLRAVADLDLADQGCSRSYVDVVAKHGYAGAAHCGGANGDAMGEIAVFADDGLWIDVNSTDMCDVEPLADGCGWVDTHLHEDFAEFVGNERDDLEWDSNKNEWLRDIEPVAEAINGDGPDGRIKQDL